MFTFGQNTICTVYFSLKEKELEKSEFNFILLIKKDVGQT